MSLRGIDPHRLAWTLRRGLVKLRWQGRSGLALLALAAGVALLGIQPAREQLRALEAQSAELRARAGTQWQEAEPPTQPSQLANFYAFFPLTGRVPELLGKIQQAAQRNALALEKGEYKLAEERDFRLARYQITLPVAGAYSQVRGFVNDVLDAIPTAALEEFTLEREAIGDEVLEARVRFALYLGTE